MSSARVKTQAGKWEPKSRPPCWECPGEHPVGSTNIVPNTLAYPSEIPNKVPLAAKCRRALLLQLSYLWLSLRAAGPLV